MRRIKLTGEELDAFSRWRSIQGWKRGGLKRIKQGYNRRFRRLAKLEIRATATQDR